MTPIRLNLPVFGLANLRWPFRVGKVLKFHFTGVICERLKRNFPGDGCKRKLKRYM